jgi:uncharacterized protein YijF (DUF1287 family)
MDSYRDELLSALKCPLAKAVMKNPMIVLEDYFCGDVLLQRGVSYDHDSLKMFPSARFVRNVDLAKLIKDYEEHFKDKLE